ncbi:MAG: dTDP-4-dehydrorhamnose 3,5-epimerase [Mariprofundales bacterium]|nr:dTDP-4-dehydrorhamnose 3,5-epimerase [Mariprofundales bacterium]
MKVIETVLPGVLIVEPKVFGDPRGFFLETWNCDRYEAAGFPEVRFVQDNHSRSRQGILRGLHFQLHHPQGKLVQVVTGAVFDVALDIRVGSPTFGCWVGYELSEENHRQMWIPPGFAHGFCVLSAIADFTYKCTDLYFPAEEGGVIWNDPEIGVDWPIQQPVLSAKDQLLASLSQIPADRLPKFA